MIGTLIGLGVGAAGTIADATSGGPSVNQVSTLDPMQQAIFAQKFKSEWDRSGKAVSGLGEAATTLGNTYGNLGNVGGEYTQQVESPSLLRMQQELQGSQYRDRRHGQINSILSQRYRDSVSDNLGLQKQKTFDTDRVLNSMLDRSDMQRQLGYAGQMNDLGSTLMTMDTGTKIKTPSQDPIAMIGNGLNLAGATTDTLGNLYNQFANYGAGTVSGGLGY